ncbi:MAG: tetratricopeptide repeat protein [Bacteroidetes bacterium]|nr:tetratricopeptide repeat protein [Bacteroidota bacterium]MBS1539728.1 tetratricopeptide repeat protein [Bacteroidota bacterium]
MEESELIDNYLQGKLTEEAANSVEARLADDKEFRKKIILRKAIISGISEAYTEELKEKLIAHDRSLETKKSTIQFSWKMAAIFTGLLVVALALLINKYYFKSRSLQKYDLAEIGIPNTMGLHGNIPFADAMNEFKSADYNNALLHFQKLLQAKSPNDTVLYYIGVSAFRLNEQTTAIKAFSEIISGKSLTYYAKAEYRLGLCYLAKGDKQRAFVIFSTIAQTPGHSYKEQALKILSEQF